MPLYHFFIDDDRYEAPVELEVRVGSEPRARQLAERSLAQSPHHLGVEVCEDGARLFGLGSFATRTWCGARARGRQRPAPLRQRQTWLQAALGPLARLARQAVGVQEPATPA